MARKWRISFSVLQNTEINFTVVPWAQTRISGPINRLFDVWMCSCILHSSWGRFSLDPRFSWILNILSQWKGLVALAVVPVGKMSEFEKYDLEKWESVGRRQKANSSRYDYWCLSALVFQSYWTDNSPSLQTIRQLFGSASFLVPFYVTLAKACHH